MIILTTTSDKIRVKLAAAGTAVKLVACWRDITSTTYLPARNGTSSNGSTEVNLVTPPSASHQLKVDFLSAYNADSVGHTVTFEFWDGSNAYPLWIGALGVSESVQYIEGIGFHRIDATGNRIDASTTGAAPAGTGFVRVTSGAYDTPSASIAQAVVTNLTSDLALKAPLISPSFTTPALGVATATSINAAGINSTVDTVQLVTASSRTIDIQSAGLSQILLDGKLDTTGGPGTFATVIAVNRTLTLACSGGNYSATVAKSGTVAMTSDLTSPGGSSGDVQYNNAGAFGGVSGMTLNLGVLQTIVVSLNVLGSSSGNFNLRNANSSSGGLGLGSLNLLAWGSANAFGTGTISGGADTILGRQAAANVRQGAAAAAAPVAQTSSVQSVATGTSNTAGANRTYSASQGTGTGAGGKHIFQVATAGTTGSSQNALVTALEIREDRSAFIANVSAAPATPTGGGLLYVEAGALKYIGSSGTITTLGAA